MENEDHKITKKYISPFSYEHADRLILESEGSNYISPFITCIYIYNY